MYALVEIQGKQYKAEKGNLLKVDLIAEDTGNTVEFESVLMISDGGKTKVGKPFVKGAKVTATVGETVKGTKIQVIKMKRRKGYRRKQGHRQQYTLLKVQEISV